MRIAQVEIRNFRNHVHTVVDFQRHHALVGMNGSGKTSILEAINMATAYRPRAVSESDFNVLDQGEISIQVWFDEYFINKVDDGFASQAVTCDAMHCHIKRRAAASPGRLLSDPFVVSITCTPAPYEHTGQLDKDRFPEGFDVRELPTSVQMTEEGIKLVRRSGNPMQVRASLINLSNRTIGFPNVFYFDRKREKQAKTGFNSLLSRITKELNWRFRKSADAAKEDLDDDSPDVHDLWDAFYDRAIELVGKDRRKHLIDDVRVTIEELSGLSFKDLELSLLNLEGPFDNAFYARRFGSNQVDAADLGSGLSLLLAYCLLEHISKQSKEEIIFLFDEPELHLHPELQKRLIASVRASEHQVIYTTHSPLLVDLGNWRSITRFDEHGSSYPRPEVLDAQLGPQLVRHHLDDIRKWRHHEAIFFDADSELFFARKVLLVEGPVDKYGLPRLANLLKKDLGSLTIVSCNGKEKICHYALLCIAYGVDAFVVFDLDGEPATAAGNASVLLGVGNLPHFAYSSSFEQLLGVSARARASTVLNRIDEIDVAEISDEIVAVIEQVSAWRGHFVEAA